MSTEHAPESEAVEAANELVLFLDAIPETEFSWVERRAIIAARALLSLSSRLETAREEMKEEAAKAVEDLFFNPPRVLCADTLDAAANAVRSLSVKAKP